MHPEDNYSDTDIKKRFEFLYGKEVEFPIEQIGFFRNKWPKLSEFIKDIKQTFSRFYISPRFKNKYTLRRLSCWNNDEF